MQASFEERLDRMAEANAGLAAQLGDALASGKLARARKYARSSEQRNLLNNRKGVNRTEEEDDSDGTPPSDSGRRQGAADTENTKSRSRVRAKGKPEGKARLKTLALRPLIYDFDTCVNVLDAEMNSATMRNGVREFCRESCNNLIGV